MAGPVSGVDYWSSRFAFLMAAIGSSVGLGNLWRFPYMTGTNGGAAFVLVYLICVAVVAFPILIAELAIGRHAQRSAVGSTRIMARDAGRSELWALAGWVGMIGGFLILTTYSVVAGWVMAYIGKMVMGQFNGLSPDAVQAVFQAHTSNLPWVLTMHALFMAITVAIISRGLHGGIERAVTVLMPMFFLMLLGMLVYAAVAGRPMEALVYLFQVDFEEIRPTIILGALGQAFFSIGVGSAIMITYGSYLPKTTSIPGSAGIIAGADTMVALVAGMAIFPIVFAFPALEPNAGPSLFFEALPTAFANMPGGQLFGAVFFTLAFVAALTSSISLLEVIVRWMVEHSDLGRTTSAMLFGGLAWFIGAGFAFSGEYGSFVDFLSGSVALPLGGLLIALFAGWAVSKQIMREELSHASDGVFAFWRVTIRFTAPIAVSVVLVMGLAAHFGLV